ncbi:MAG: ATP-dependent RecD-like DNA helicase [Candidatus Babeliales bacterium]
MTPVDQLQGTIDRILFNNQETGFSVFVMVGTNKQEIIVTGTLPTLQAGEQVTVQGSWVMHPKFGKQFQATTCVAQLPTTVVGIEKYLGSGLIKGIGKAFAKKIVARFGANTLTIIEQEPERLATIEGIGTKRIDQIKHAWHQQKAVSAIMIFLQEKDISPVFATKIYKQYGQNAIALLQENPYRLAEDIWGVGFKTADTIAHKIGIAKNSIQRVKAGLLFVLSQATNQGHLYLTVDQLKEQAITLLELAGADEQLCKTALHELYEQTKIKLISHQDAHYIALSQYYFSEKGVAQRLKNLQETVSDIVFDIASIYTQLRTETSGHIELNEDQQRAILTCLQNKVTVITGGPGTGKTTLIKRLLSLLDAQHLQYHLAAPTGRAAKRIIEGTGKYAATLHRLLQFDASNFSFIHNEKNALKGQFFIIDESSMIDIFLAAALVKAIPLRAHLIFIGDTDQLPSVGAGNFLSDLLKTPSIAHVRLTHIFRQAANSLIVVNAHRINRGEFPVFQAPDTKKDFIFIKEEKVENLVHHIHRFCQNKSLNPYVEDTMILTPMNKGVAGTHNLNHQLQPLLNPHEKPSYTHIGTQYKVGDRVMQIRNNYDKHVFNGDIGIIEDIDTEMHTITVRFDEREVTYDTHEMDELVLAYAISIHKSQGSEYGAVIIPLFMQHFMLLQRNLLYTAITRAKRLCIIIGQPKALAIAIKNNKTVQRQTFLKEFLSSDLTCR